MGRFTRACRTRRVATVVLAALLTLSVGCNEIMELPYTPERMDPGPARSKTGEVSERLRKLAGVEGRVTEPDMSLVVCDEYGENLFDIQHHWSLNVQTTDKVDTGMQNLRKALGENGWKITEDGPKIVASNETDHFSMTVTVHDPALGHDPMLDFTVGSRCYRASSRAALNEG
ncbi:hypothetical protein ACFXA3_15495 [Streptomyces sp. NPDC059456]|uniref:hypothetical protein n=1 Tax=Streptomyces sp. NPDC059456 TaxID=3346838 RepID=UPI0036C7ECE7